MSTVSPISANPTSSVFTIGQVDNPAKTSSAATDGSTFADVLIDAVEETIGDTETNPEAETQTPGTGEQLPGTEVTNPEAETQMPPIADTTVPDADAVVPDTNVTAPGTEDTAAAETTQAAEQTTEDTNVSMPDTGTPVYGLDVAVPEDPDMNSLEQAINTAATTRDNNDMLMALMMMMMIMMAGSSGGGGDMSMLMPLMSALFDNMQQKDEVRNQFMLQSGGDPAVLDEIDAGVFGNPSTPVPETSETGEAVLPLEWWKPTTPAVVNTQTDRNAFNYRAVIDQFNVENAKRYEPFREGHTYCNVYVWDVTRAMGAEIPYYADPADGSPMQYPDIKGANYQGAKAMDNWLKTRGENFGWRQVTAEEAQMYANQGRPTVASGGNTGHISMVCPSQDGSFDPVRGVTVAQAGRIVTNYTHISGIWGSSALNNQVTYWTNMW